MRRENTKRAALAIAVLTLGVGPWLGLPTSSASIPAWSSFGSSGFGRSLIGQTAFEDDAPIGLIRRASGGGCTCREITVDAENIVKNAEVETGDATVVNRSITYIAPSYGEDEVEIEQDAEAETGDAVAGQILAVDGGDGCSRVHVRAKNIVRDAEVKSGDATARNESLVLLDPRLRSEELEIEVDQDAEAESGDAVAGQIIGIKGGGGPCGGVILDALNDVRNVDVESGDATIENISEIKACAEAGCSRELRRSLEGVLLVDVCDAQGCRPVKTERFIDMLEREAEDNVDADAVGDADSPIEKAAAEAGEDGDDDDDPEADDEEDEERRDMPRWFYLHQPKAPRDGDTESASNATPTASQAPTG